MPTLYVLSGPELGRSFSIQAGDTLGRSPDRIITLRHPSVSREHAHFEQEDGVWQVVDDGSQNGVSFQGQRAARAALFDGAEFALGEIQLRFRLDPPEAGARAAAPAEPVEEEIFLPGDEREPGPPAASRARAAAAPPPAPAASAVGAPRASPPARTAAGGDDLAQYPAWARALLVLLALALAGAIAYLAFRGTSFVKEQVQGEAAREP